MLVHEFPEDQFERSEGLRECDKAGLPRVCESDKQNSQVFWRSDSLRAWQLFTLSQ